jgi:hypothetical protein
MRWIYQSGISRFLFRTVPDLGQSARTQLAVGTESDEPGAPIRCGHDDRINLQPLTSSPEYQPSGGVYAFSAGWLVAYLVKLRRSIPTLIVTTDYDFHSQWLSRLFNRYFVAANRWKSSVGVERVFVRHRSI